MEAGVLNQSDDLLPVLVGAGEDQDFLGERVEIDRLATVLLVVEDGGDVLLRGFGESGVGLVFLFLGLDLIDKLRGNIA